MRKHKILLTAFLVVGMAVLVFVGCKKGEEHPSKGEHPAKQEQPAGSDHPQKSDHPE